MEEVIKLFEYAETACSKLFGTNKWWNLISASTFFLMGFLSALSFLYKLISKLLIRRSERKFIKYTQPFFSKSDVLRATSYYVLPKFQNVAPSEDEELGTNYIASAKQPLMPLFLNTVFKKEKLDEKFFLILGDTGMGKTSFLINLYIKYKSKRYLFNAANKYDIVLLPLGFSDIFEKINLIQNKSNTILLLDAFDEDLKAIDRHEERMNEIISVVSEFRFVVITCRTQFFPSEKEEPERTKYLTFGDSQKEYRFQKIYLSVFDNKDIKKYLIKRFGLYPTKRFRKAQRIAEKSPTLVVRPLLLSYINELLESETSFKFSIEIYEVLIRKWIKRESKKPGILEKYKDQTRYEKILYNFSKDLALDLYLNRNARGGYYINKDDKIPYNVEMQLEDIENEYKFTNTEWRSKSLLNRNSTGRYKFSHKSILEYFLAIHLIEKNIHFFRKFEFDGMSITKTFCEELSYKYLMSLSNSDQWEVKQFYSKEELERKVSDETVKHYDTDISNLRQVEYLYINRKLGDQEFNYKTLIFFPSLKWVYYDNGVGSKVKDTINLVNFIKFIKLNPKTKAVRCITTKTEYSYSVNKDAFYYYVMYETDSKPIPVPISKMLRDFSKSTFFKKNSIRQNHDNYRLMIQNPRIQEEIQLIRNIVSQSADFLEFINNDEILSVCNNYNIREQFVFSKSSYDNILDDENYILNSVIDVKSSIEENVIYYIFLSGLFTSFHAFESTMREVNDLVANLLLLKKINPKCNVEISAPKGQHSF